MATIVPQRKTSDVIVQVSSKIKVEHLSRRAYLYIRQSTLSQVLRNTGSTTQQYDFKRRAVDLGWSLENIISVDIDQGKSAVATDGRCGYLELLDAINSGRCGAIFCIKVDRLSRNDFDGHQLLQLCYKADTLIIDGEGIYNLRDYNDRLILGVKTLVSFAEHHLITSRMQECRMALAKEGKLRIPLPAGYLYDQDGQIVLDPDKDVQRTIRLIFDLFQKLGVARQVCKYFIERNFKIPRHTSHFASNNKAKWTLLSRQRIQNILRNPVYAGAYVYKKIKDENKADPETWAVQLRDHHPSYITWKQYQHNLSTLSDNKNKHSSGSKGVIRGGTSLLQGTIIICDNCGKRMWILYNKDKNNAAYACFYKWNTHGGRTCQWIPARQVDIAVGDLLLQAIKPAQLQASIKMLEQCEAKANFIEQQYQIQLRRAKGEADLAYRYLQQVEPENRYAARRLEKELDEKLRELEHLERNHLSHEKCILSDTDRQSIMSLAEEFPKVWYNESTPMEKRKRILRLLIKKVFLKNEGSTVRVTIRWETDAYTCHSFPRIPSNRVSPFVLNLIRELALNHTDSQIAERLCLDGLVTGRKEQFTTEKVKTLRRNYEIPTSCPETIYRTNIEQRGDGRYTCKAAARLLNVDENKMLSMCNKGEVDAIRLKPRMPWWIRLSPEDINRLKKPSRRRS